MLNGVVIGGSLPSRIIDNVITSNTLDVDAVSANISFNVFDTINGIITGSFNVKSDGTPW